MVIKAIDLMLKQVEDIDLMGTGQAYSANELKTALSGTIVI